MRNANFPKPTGQPNTAPTVRAQASRAGRPLAAQDAGSVEPPRKRARSPHWDELDRDAMAPRCAPALPSAWSSACPLDRVPLAEPGARAAGLGRSDGPSLLRDRRRDASLREGIDTLLELRARQAADEKIRFRDLTTYTQSSADNAVELHLERAYFEQAVLPAIARAKRSIHIAMLDFDDSLLGAQVADELIARKRQHPEMPVRVIVDAGGSEAMMPWGGARKTWRRLRDEGIEVIVNWEHKHGLEHRKLVVVDSAEAFFGGSCFAGEYYASKAHREAYEAALQGGPDDVDHYLRVRYGDDYVDAIDAGTFPPPARVDTEACRRPEFRDYGLRFTGTAVKMMELGFLQSWVYHGGRLDPELDDAALEARYFSPTPRAAGETRVKVTNSVPLGETKMGRNLMDIIKGAQHTLDVELAYILVPSVVEALMDAARRGVKVRIVVPGEGYDSESPYLALRNRYRELIDAGVEVYEYDQYTHVKLMVADQRFVFASTGNPEAQSWWWGWDEIALMDSPALASEIEHRLFEVDIPVSRRITPEDLASDGLWKRFKMSVHRRAWDLLSRPGHRAVED